MKLYPLTATMGSKIPYLMQAGARAAQPRVSLFSRRDYAQYEFIQKWFNAQKPAELLRMNNPLPWNILYGILGILLSESHRKKEENDETSYGRWDIILMLVLGAYK